MLYVRKLDIVTFIPLPILGAANLDSGTFTYTVTALVHSKRVYKLQNTNFQRPVGCHLIFRRGFGSQHVHPSSLVFIRGFDRDAQLLRCVHCPMWVSQKFTRDKYNVCLAVLQIGFRLLRRGDQTHSAVHKFGVGFLECLCEWNLHNSSHVNTRVADSSSA